MKKFFSAIFLVFSLICLTGSAYPTSTSSSEIIYDDVIIDENQLLSILKPGDIAFGVFQDIMDKDNSLESPLYSDYEQKYAGAQINEKGNLIIYITDYLENQNSLNNDLDFNLDNKESIEFRITNLSYGQLLNLQKEVCNICADAIDSGNILRQNWAKRVKAIMIDVENNQLLLLENGLTESEYQDCCKELYDIPFSTKRVEGSVSIENETSTVKPGQSNCIYHSDTDETDHASVGFRCVRNGYVGYITTFHEDNTSTGTTVRDESGNYLGYIDGGAYDYYADFCFVRTGDSDLVSSSTYTTPQFNLTASYIASPPVGLTVLMAGRNSIYIRYGSVVADNVSFTEYPGSSALICDYSSSPGDSGGMCICIFKWRVQNNRNS